MLLGAQSRILWKIFGPRCSQKVSVLNRVLTLKCSGSYFQVHGQKNAALILRVQGPNLRQPGRRSRASLTIVYFTGLLCVRPMGRESESPPDVSSLDLRTSFPARDPASCGPGQPHPEDHTFPLRCPPPRPPVSSSSGRHSIPVVPVGEEDGDCGAAARSRKIDLEAGERPARRQWNVPLERPPSIPAGIHPLADWRGRQARRPSEGSRFVGLHTVRGTF